MIIDTNGFEIGDEVWAVSYYFNHASAHSFKIYSFNICEDGIIASANKSLYFSQCNIQSLFHSEQECQLACDKLNGVNHD